MLRYLLAAIGALVLTSPMLAFIAFNQHLNNVQMAAMHRDATMPIPPLNELPTATGTLLQSVSDSHSGAGSSAVMNTGGDIAILRKTNGELIPFNCKAGDGDDLYCIYPSRQDQQSVVGKKATIYYFQAPQYRYSAERIKRRSGKDLQEIDGLPMNVVMEAFVEGNGGRQYLVKYADSIKRVREPYKGYLLGYLINAMCALFWLAATIAFYRRLKTPPYVLKNKKPLSIGSDNASG